MTDTHTHDGGPGCFQHRLELKQELAELFRLKEQIYLEMRKCMIELIRHRHDPR